MSLLELCQQLSAVWPVLLVLSVGSPAFLYIWGRRQHATSGGAGESRAFGQIASALVALGLVTVVLALLTFAYLHGQGTNLVTEVPVLALLAPFWFGGGNLFAATRHVSFARLRTYPLLRRVWAVLSVGALLFVAWLVLRHTYWLVFSGIIGFAIVAIIAYTLFRKLGRRATSPAPRGGDPDLFDEVVEDSQRRAGRLLSALNRPKRRP